MSDLEVCNLDPFLAEAIAQQGSLEDAAQAVEIVTQQLEGYLERMRTAMCADLQAIVAQQVSSFLGLSDTPDSYVGSAGLFAAVNAGEDAIEFVAGGGGGGLPDLDDNTEVASGRQFNGNDTFFKPVNLGTLPNIATKSVAHNIGAAFQVVHIYGMANDPTAPRAIPLPFTTLGAILNQIVIDVDGTNVNVITGVNRTNFTASWVVLEYYYL